MLYEKEFKRTDMNLSWHYRENLAQVISATAKMSLSCRFKTVSPS